ncbi:MAG: OmpA family protein [Gammaproteobacteria bacterium]|nr:OmpA family protein [Gammaproteobacteria bacterium]
MKTYLRFAMLASGLTAGVAAGQPAESVSENETVTESRGYVSILPYHYSIDSDRAAGDDGRGLAIAYGRRWHGGWFWEAQTYGTLLDTPQDASTDFYQHGASLDVGVRLNPRSDGASPFFIAGAGLVRNDVFPDAGDDTDWTGNVGLGFVTGGLGNGGVRLRGEARYVYDTFETPAGQDGMNEWRIGLGVMVPLGRRVVERELVRERVVTETVTETAPADIVDSDDDGVPDQIDRCPGTLEGLATDNRGCASEAQTLRLDGVNFELNSAQLTPGASETLRRVAESLRGEPNLRAEIAGHTDSSGADDYNMRLSQQRAESVREFLISQGVEADRLRARGYGETQPVAGNDTESGRAMNRRVEFRVVN